MLICVNFDDLLSINGYAPFSNQRFPNRGSTVSIFSVHKLSQIRIYFGPCFVLTKPLLRLVFIEEVL